MSLSEAKALFIYFIYNYMMAAILRCSGRATILKPSPKLQHTLHRLQIKYNIPEI